MTKAFEQLLDFCAALDRRKARYELLVARPEAVTVLLTVPGERWEIEFFSDGHIELERFVSRGVADAGPADLEAALQHLEPSTESDADRHCAALQRWQACFEAVCAERRWDAFEDEGFMRQTADADAALAAAAHHIGSPGEDGEMRYGLAAFLRRLRSSEDTQAVPHVRDLVERAIETLRAEGVVGEGI